MKITDLAIRYRPSVAILTVMLTAGGLFSYVTIPKESFPSIEIPNIIVTTVYPGASPGDIESLLTQPIEQEIQGISGIKEIRSISSEGVSTVIIEFTPDVSIDDAFQKVRDKVDIAKTELPSDVEEPLVSEIDLQELPIMSINLAGPYSLSRLKDVAENLAEEIETVPQILEVQVVGALEREVKVNVDLHALQGYGLAFEDVVNTIRDENANIPGGSIDVDRLNYLVRIDGEFEDPEGDLRRLVLKAEGGRPVYINDVADVEFGFQDQSTFARLRVLQVDNGSGLMRIPNQDVSTYPVITLNVKKRAGANILDTANSVKAILDNVSLPQGARSVITGDQSEIVQTFITDLENNIISGLIFVILVLLFFLGVRTATLVGIAIPLSMFLSFIVFHILGQELNFVILFSLIIALGMLVDNAVVIVENIYRYREMGHPRFRAARLGTKEVGNAVVASTLTTVAVFVPMMFWPGIVGEFMSYLPLTLIVTLLCSLFVAIIINPVITGYFVRLDVEEAPRRTRMVKVSATLIVVIVGLMIGLSNWKTLIVLAVTIPVLAMLHRYVFSPVASGFVRSGLPKLITWYRGFVALMLERDYASEHSFFARRLTWRTAAVAGIAGCLLLLIGLAPGTFSIDPQVAQMIFPAGILGAIMCVVCMLLALLRTRNAYLRNSFACVTLAFGLSLSAGGGIIALQATPVAGYVLLIPGVVLLVTGLIAVILHALELVYLGGWQSVKAGAIFAAVSIVALSIMSVAKGTEFATILILSLLPAGIIGIGALGTICNGRLFRYRRRLLLTDNRACLLVGTVAGFLAIVGLFGAAPTGTEFFPDTDPSIVTVSMENPLGTNVDETNRVTSVALSRVIGLLDDNVNDRDNVKNMLANVGTGGDVMFGGGAAGAENAVITLNMVDYQDRPETSRNTLSRLRQQLLGIPGVQIEIDKDDAGPPVGKPVNIEISGENFNQITHFTQEVKQLLQTAAADGSIPGLVDLNDNLNTGRPEMGVRIDRERAAQFGLNTRQIANTVRAAINGVEATTYRTGSDEYPVMVRLAEDYRQSLEAVEKLTIAEEGSQIPITAVADFEFVGGLGNITRLDLQRVATITGDVAPGYNGAAVLASVQQHLADFEASLPPGYVMAYTGENEEQAEAFGFLGTALMIGISLILLILIAQFNSVIVPFIIMVAVTLSLIGVVFGLILTRTAFGLMTFIGIISLAGIVVNNNIVLIDYIRQLRDRGLGKAEAIIEGGATRLRPVVLTGLTTVIGLVPLTFGINIDFVGLLTNLEPNFQFGSENTQFWGAMGTAIISGLVFATFLTLVIVPVMYSVFDSLGVHLGTLFRSREAEPAE